MSAISNVAIDTTQNELQQQDESEQKELSTRDKLIILIVIIFFLTGFILFLVYRDTGLAASLSSMLEWFEKIKWAGLIILLILYTVSMIFIIPIKSILALVFGLFYGLPFGLFLTYISAIIGIFLAFIMGRYLCKSMIDRFIYVFCIKRFKESNLDDTDKKKSEKYQKYIELFNYLCKDEGWKTVLMVRFSFFPPSEWTNYIFANTLVSFKDFAIGSTIGRLFATASIYVYVGSTLSNIVQIINGDYPDTFWYSFGITLGLYIFFFILLIILTRRAKKWLKGKKEIYNAKKKLHAMNATSDPYDY